VRAVLTEPFAANLIASPPEIQRLFGKQLANLLRDLRHPSLRAKKYDEKRKLWQARVNDDWRFFFTIEGDLYVLRAITPHPR
jgi:plasmid maintenance system killer protein